MNCGARPAGAHPLKFLAIFSYNLAAFFMRHARRLASRQKVEVRIARDPSAEPNPAHRAARTHKPGPCEAWSTSSTDASSNEVLPPPPQADRDVIRGARRT